MSIDILCDFSDFSANKTVRITPDRKWASVHDIIKVIGGQQNTRMNWQRLQSDLELVTFCDNFKFEKQNDEDNVQGQRGTPVISKEGVFLLIQAIPGKRAQNIRLQCAQKLVAVMGGDQTLIGEIEENARIAASDPTSSQAFFAKDNGAKNKVVKSVKQPLQEFTIYVRGYDALVNNQQQITGNNKGKGSALILTIDILKFGRSNHHLENRSITYGNDGGSFAFSIQVPNEEIAKHVEKVLRARFSNITIPNRYEYIYVKGLFEQISMKQPTTYNDALRCMFSIVLGELHSLYPDLSNIFGISYKTSLVTNIQGIVTLNDENQSLSTKINVLTIADLPEYTELFPSLSEQHVTTHLNTKLCKRLEIEREKTKREVEKTKQEEVKLLCEQVKAKREKEKRKTLILSLRIAQLQNGSTTLDTEGNDKKIKILEIMEDSEEEDISEEEKESELILTPKEKETEETDGESEKEFEETEEETVNTDQTVESEETEKEIEEETEESKTEKESEEENETVKETEEETEEENEEENEELETEKEIEESAKVEIKVYIPKPKFIIPQTAERKVKIAGVKGVYESPPKAKVSAKVSATTSVKPKVKALAQTLVSLKPPRIKKSSTKSFSFELKIENEGDIENVINSVRKHLPWFTNDARFHVAQIDEDWKIQGEIKTEERENADNMSSMIVSLIPNIQITKMKTKNVDRYKNFRTHGPFKINAQRLKQRFVFKIIRDVDLFDDFLQMENNGIKIAKNASREEPTFKFGDFVSHLRFYGFRNMPPMDILNEILTKYGILIKQYRPCYACNSPRKLGFCCLNYSSDAKGTVNYMDGIKDLKRSMT